MNKRGIFIFILVAVLSMSLIFAGDSETQNTQEWLKVAGDFDSSGNYDGEVEHNGLTLAWKYTFAASSTSYSAIGDNGFVYMGANDLKIHCFNATTGTENWSRTFDGSVKGVPALSQDILYVPVVGQGVNSTLSALNATNGSIIWNVTVNSSINFSPVVSAGKVYFAARNNIFYAYNASTGAYMWNATFNDSHWSGSVVTAGEHIYLGNRNDYFYSINWSNSGSQIWNYSTGGNTDGIPARSSGFIFFSSADGKVYALNATNGSYVWNASISVDGGVIATRGYVFAGSNDDSFYALNATNGSVMWSYASGADIDGIATVSNGLVWFVSQDRQIYALNITSGLKVWNYTLSNSLSNDNSPMLMNNFVYVSDGLALYAFTSYNNFNGTTYDTNGALLGNASVNVSYYTLGATGMTFVGSKHVWSNPTTGYFSLNLTINDSWYYRYELRHWNTTYNFVDKVSKPAMYLGSSFVNNLTDMKYYLYDAGIINLTAITSAGNHITFGYFVRDKSLSYEIEEATDSVSNETTIYVPKDRNYSVMIWPVDGGGNNFVPVSFEVNFSSSVDYNISQNGYSWFNATTNTVHKTFNTSESQARIWGYVNTSLLTSFDNLSVVPYVLMPGDMIEISTGVIPFNASAWWGETDVVNNDTGFYNITVPYSASEEVNYMLFFAAQNGTDYYAGWQNVTSLSTNSVEIQNFSLVGMLGNVTMVNQSTGTGGSRYFFTNYYNFSFVNASNDSISNVEGIVEVTVNYPGLSAFTFSGDVSVGTTTVSVPLLNSAGVQEVIVYSGAYVPRENSYAVTELTGNGLNVSLATFAPKKATGAALSGLTVTAYVSNSTCDVPNVPDGCVVANFSYTSANLMTMLPVILGGGKISMRMTTDDVRVHFVNVDLLASGPPDARYTENGDVTEGTSVSFTKAMKYGSFGPKVYDYVLVSLPYTEGSTSTAGLNESATVQMQLYDLYDEDSWNTPIWNVTLNGTSGVGLAGNYSHYKDTTAWTTLLTGTNCGTVVGSISASTPCYINTTADMIWLRLPHFSGTQPALLASASNTTATSTSTSTSTSSSDSSSGSASDETTEEEDEEEEEEEVVVEEQEAELVEGDWAETGETTFEGLQEGDTFDFSFEIGNDTHLYSFEVQSVSNGTAILNVYNGDSQEIILELEETIRVDLDGDGVDDVEFTLVSIEDGFADIQMKKVVEEESWFKWWYALVLVLVLALIGGVIWFFLRN